MSGGAWIWCEHCRDHYQEDHYGEDGGHRAGMACGPTGRAMLEGRALRKIVAVCGAATTEAISVAVILNWVPADLLAAIEAEAQAGVSAGAGGEQG